MKKIFIIIVIIALIAAAAYLYFVGGPAKDNQSKTAVSSGAASGDIAEIAGYQYTEAYSNPAYRFSFRYPGDFIVSNIDMDEDGEVIVVENVAKKIGVQILISSFGADTDITEEIIRREVPDFTVTEPQQVEIGANRKGLAFLSDNEEFGGRSREVWFVYGGNLYQISTYAELDGFLKGLFGTWEFVN